MLNQTIGNAAAVMAICLGLSFAAREILVLLAKR